MKRIVFIFSYLLAAISFAVVNDEFGQEKTPFVSVAAKADWDHLFNILKKVSLEPTLKCLSKDVPDLPPGFDFNKYVLFSDRHLELMEKILAELIALDIMLQPKDEGQIDRAAIKKKLSDIKYKLAILEQASPKIEGRAVECSACMLCAFGAFMASTMFYGTFGVGPAIALTAVGASKNAAGMLMVGEILSSLCLLAGLICSGSIAGCICCACSQKLDMYRRQMPISSLAPETKEMTEY